MWSPTAAPAGHIWHIYTLLDGHGVNVNQRHEYLRLSAQSYVAGTRRSHDDPTG